MLVAYGVPRYYSPSVVRNIIVSGTGRHYVSPYPAVRYGRMHVTATVVLYGESKLIT